ncbi:Acetyltransferase (GNAT) domain-containing protein [Micromonospora haikouensis]|uniref:Acetyltransferase (GNAT) domain-containing protein n=1 Tax=Micromonospora haikouensis TaxID=686309 RepID=A0A1C4U0E4_9ACTN|nr:GNAT family N-acetyltransferase [Micromonospora haikouensis]SCE65165.1 Acetyltransferase (GNAT) domain-containing protein [Micromonospora haikouensis]
MTVLTTERLNIRDWTAEPGDLARIYDIYSRAELLKPLPGRDERVPTTDIEVGWHLHPDSWGHGYATEAARALAARELATGTPRVWAVVSPGNTASAAVARRLGMAYVGRRTDWYGGEELDAFVLRATP